jgi:asparagine synthase (glutamine-hydrolysing)
LLASAPVLCGIAGFHGGLRASGERILREMIEALGHRGPDGRGVSLAGDVGLAATRLSLVDAERGGQPMVDGDVAIVFNGEIYNHVALREELEGLGVTFRGRSDTEVVLRGYLRWGPAVLDRLEGMFAIAIRDGAVLHLARDAFGMKPLFHGLCADAQTLVFASEIKALLRFPHVPRRLDATGLVEQLVFGHTLGQRTLLADIRQVAPGHHVIVERHEQQLLVTSSPWSPPRPLPPPPRSVDEAADRLVERLRESVARRVEADHPVATYLSGGLDSSLVASLRPDHVGSRSFLVADGKDVSDLPHARAVAAALGLQHTEIIVPRAPPRAWVANAVLAMEAPSAPSLALVSAARVRQEAKAAVCGEGSDELFGGYPMHDEPEPYLRRFEERVSRLRSTAPLAETALATTTERIAALRVRDPAARTRAVFDFLLHEVMPGKHLAIWDRGSMASSLEVRMPYLDRAIQELALSLPPQWSQQRKQLVVMAARRALPTAVAGAITTRTKAAAPDALGAMRHRLRSLAGAAMPYAWLRTHPLQRLTSAPHVLLALDLFLLAFLVGNGALPEGFAFETMYSRHERELRAAHQAAGEALFSANGAP